jgi:hypothetical protein
MMCPDKYFIIIETVVLMQQCRHLLDAVEDCFVTLMPPAQ